MERRYTHHQEQPATSWTDLTNRMREYGVPDSAIRTLVDRGVEAGHLAPTSDLVATAELLIETQTKKSALKDKSEQDPPALEVETPTRVLNSMGERAIASTRGRISGTLDEPTRQRARPIHFTPPPELRQEEEPLDLSEDAVRRHVQELYGKDK